MGKETGITWCDHTFNPWWGCVRVSPGCEHCYAETFSKRMGLNIWGSTERRFFGDKHWNEPIAWNKQAEQEGKVHRVFCASMADVFEVFKGLDIQRFRLWNLVEHTPWLEWLILTKRPENISTRIPSEFNYMTSNVRLGVTAEDQEYGDRRIAKMLEVWGGKNFVSYEPALGPLHIGRWIRPEGHDFKFSSDLDWMICGGESGAGCRPMNLDWARHLRSECRTANIPFFFKQMGGFPDKRHDPAGWPEDLRIQEFPVAKATDRINELEAQINDCTLHDESAFRGIMELERQLEQAQEQVKELEATEKKYKQILGVVTERHGDDEGWDNTIDEWHDTRTTITVKMIFDILEEGEQSDSPAPEQEGKLYHRTNPCHNRVRKGRDEMNLRTYLDNVKHLHESISADVWPDGTWLHCTVCDRWEKITTRQCGYYLANGWPMCCGQTMNTNDKPAQEVQS